MFLLFDIEILFLYPVCTSILEFNSCETLNLCIFFALISLGLLYEISRGLVCFYGYDKLDKDESDELNTLAMTELTQKLKKR